MSARAPTIPPGGGSAALPDFRNLGVLLRIVVLAEAVRIVFLLVSTTDSADFFFALVGGSDVFEPVLLGSLLLLIALSPRLNAMPYRIALAAVVGVVLLITAAWFWLIRDFQFGSAHEVQRLLVDAALICVLAIWYFDCRRRILSPALTEARLIALQARIRPHFLFNSLNTVLGLMRVEPRRAEGVLENLAELYRALLSESGVLVPLGRELELARGYAEIEAMRLGSRFTVNWQCQGAPLDALVPPLILQPLLENAVYHGVEPSEAGGIVSVTIFLKGGQLNLVVRNPCDSPVQRRSGNRMALDNIRERLALHFDAEAEMSAYEAGGEFVVQIRIPYKHV